MNITDQYRVRGEREDKRKKLLKRDSVEYVHDVYIYVDVCVCLFNVGIVK
jgi:hypothetical protein